MATGKYAAVIDKLPRLLGTEPAYQEKVNVVKAEIVKELATPLGPPVGSDFAYRYTELRAQKEEIEEQLSAINLQIEAINQLIVDQFESEGVSSVRLSTGASVSVQYEPSAQVVDKEAFRLWCLAQGLERSMVLPWMTTNAITKERLLAGDPEPEGVKAHAKTKLVLRKG